MKLLTFQARRFRWELFERTLDTGDATPGEAGAHEVRDAVVVFMHAEARDEGEEAARRAVRHTVKHVKWLANKRDLRNVVLHSFTHLGGDTAAPEVARELIDTITVRLRSGGYEVDTTPFGATCTWDLEVFGEAIAKVWKEI